MAQLLDRAPAPAGPASTAAYRVLADRLRRDVQDRRYPDGRRLPTEAELSADLGLSRQTVRRAFQELVAEGLVYRVPGRGTFACEPPRYLRPAGSIEDLLTISDDTELEVVEPPAVGVDLEAAGRLHLTTDHVVTITFRRHHAGLPFCVTTAYLPTPIGRGLLEVEELNVARVRLRTTVLSVVQGLAGTAIVGADQSITAVPAPPHLGREIDVEPGEPVLRIDRVYSDGGGRRVELAVNHFNPARYSYRVHMGSTGR